MYQINQMNIINSISLDGTNKQALTPDDDGIYAAKFSPHAGWYTLSYKGPNIPSQKLYSTHDPSELIDQMIYYHSFNYTAL